jgi:sugar lactone lactonase YvrE
MVRKLLVASAIVAGGCFAYLLAWPVPITPVAWKAPADPGFTGPFAVNRRLSGLQRLPLGSFTGPEDVAIDAAGNIYVGTHQGRILKLPAGQASFTPWVDTGGRPLGLAFDARGQLVVADAYRGLLSVAPDGKISELATASGGTPIRFADDVAVAADGKIYFSDASVKFGAREHGVEEASILDLLEHGGHGRVLVYDPATRAARAVLDGLNFANGVTLSPDQSFLLVAETGSYRVVRLWLKGPRQGWAEPFAEELPGLPDNLSTGQDGRFWVALVAPRDGLLDRLSSYPFLRRVVPRLPAPVRPGPRRYGHIIALDASGKVVASLQDPAGEYPLNTSVLETPDYLYLGSLVAPSLARLARQQAGL